MSTISAPAAGRSPWHLWVVAIMTLLWNGSGAYTIAMAQAGRLADVDANESAYYAAQPLWFVITTDIAILLPLTPQWPCCCAAGKRPGYSRSR
jgi:hypothetical protein